MRLTFYIVAAVALSIPMQATAETAVHLYRLDGRLNVLGESSWSAGGAVAGDLGISSSGAVVAVVKPAAAPLQLATWTDAGRLSSREPLDAAAVVSSHLAPDGALVLATRSGIVKLGSNGRILARRELSLPASDELSAYATASGAWFASPERLWFAGFAGDGPSRAVPIAEGATAIAGILPLESGCLVAEERTVHHKLSGNPGGDPTTQLSLTVLGAAGEVAAQRTLGEVHEYTEWLWKESGYVGWSSFGLARKRHWGHALLRGMGGASDGDVVVVLQEDHATRVTRLHRDLQPVWSAPTAAFGHAEISPPSTKDLLIVTEKLFAATFDEHGNPGPTTTLPRSPPSSGSVRVAIGRTAAGDWLVASY